MVRRWLFAAFVVASGCTLAPLDELGKKCAEDRPCGEGYACERGACVLAGEHDGGSDAGVDAGMDGGRANLFLNPGFEDGANVGWKGGPAVLSNETGIVFEGTRSAKAVPIAGLTNLSIIPLASPYPMTQPGQIFCASMRVNSRSGVDLRLILRERDDAGSFAPGSDTDSVVTDGGWQALKCRYTTQGGLAIDVRLFTATGTDAGAIYVDDARLTLEPGACPSP